MPQQIEIVSRDYWYTVVDFLQEDWALIEPDEHSCTVYFIVVGVGVFNRLPFASTPEAEALLRRNGFHRYADVPAAQKLLRPPAPPFFEAAPPHDPARSSARYDPPL